MHFVMEIGQCLAVRRCQDPSFRSDSSSTSDEGIQEHPSRRKQKPRALNLNAASIPSAHPVRV